MVALIIFRKQNHTCKLLVIRSKTLPSLTGEVQIRSLLQLSLLLMAYLLLVKASQTDMTGSLVLATTGS